MPDHDPVYFIWAVINNKQETEDYLDVAALKLFLSVS